jgi:glycosyltransferase involved in cell wall biosynthesis
MRVLLVTHYYPEHRGGVEIIAGQLARRLAGRGIELVWAASHCDPPPAWAGVTALPIRSWNGLEKRLGIPLPIWSLGGLRRVARAVEQADIVHLHDSLYLGNLIAYLAARRRQIPVIVTQHIGLVPYRNRALRGLMTLANHTVGRLTLGGCDKVVFYSDEVRSYFARFTRFRESPQMISNGVDRDLFFPSDVLDRQALRARLGLTADRPCVLFVGRFVEKKGLPVLHRLAEHFPQYDWLFIGWGPDEPAQWRLPHVRQIGSATQQEVADYYRAADLLVLPSVGEGFPLVIQEALSCGLPVLTSVETARACPGIELVAWTCEPTFEALSQLLPRILGERAEVAARRQAAARFSAERWDWDRSVERYRQLYEACAPCSASVCD